MYFFSAELFIIISKPLTIRLHCWAECSISVTGYITDWKPCYWYWFVCGCGRKDTQQKYVEQ